MYLARVRDWRGMIDCSTIISDSWDITRRDVLFSADRDTEVQRYLDPSIHWAGCGGAAI